MKAHFNADTAVKYGLQEAVLRKADKSYLTVIEDAAFTHQRRIEEIEAEEPIMYNWIDTP